MSGKELFIRFTASAFRKLLSIYVFSYFPFGFEGRIWDLIAYLFTLWMVEFSRRYFISFYFVDGGVFSENFFNFLLCGWWSFLGDIFYFVDGGVFSEIFFSPI